MAAAMQDPEHPVCKGEYRANRRPNSKTAGVGRVDHDICSMDRFDRILRDPVLKTLHQSPAGGNFYMSSTHYMEKWGPPEAVSFTTAAIPKTVTATANTTTPTAASCPRVPAACDPQRT